MKGISFFIVLTFLGCGALPKEDPVQGPLSSRQESYRQCYVESDSYQGKEDSAKGTVVVNFIVTTAGKVKEAKILKSDFKDANLHACLLDQIRQIKFHEFKTETVMDQPIHFHPVKI
jgi:TonB family protein